MAQMPEPIVVTRPRGLPRPLMRLAADHGMEPLDLIARAASKYPTFGEAAASLGITEKTFYKYRQLLGIRVITA